MIIKGVTLSFLVLIATLSVHSAFAAEPQVKKSNSNICHPKNGRYYHKTKNYIPYKSMDACIKSGGRAAKR